MANSNDELADLCLDHAWRDEIDDDTRWLLEQAGARINRLGRRCLRLSHRLEELEARREESWTRPLIERDGFCLLVRSGVSVHEIARRMDCTRDAVRKAARQLGRLTPAPENVGELLVAPSDEEEQLSQSTLALAPSVAVLAKQVKQRSFDAIRRGERSPYARPRCQRRH
jgi:transposase-like protein